MRSARVSIRPRTCWCWRRRRSRFGRLRRRQSSHDAFDGCTRSLFVLDQLLPGTSGFALWDTDGNSLCSSKGATRNRYHVNDRLWFQTARERNGIASGDYELAPPDDQPSIGFGMPITDPATKKVVAYLSTGLKVDDADDLLAGANLPETGRVFIVDQNGVIINSTIGLSGTQTEAFSTRFGALNNFLDARVNDTTNGRRAAAVRITDAGDASVAVVVSAEPDTLAAPLLNTLWRDLWPVAVLTLLTLIALWLLAQRWVLNPVGSLVRASDALESGRLDARAKVRSSVSEFRRLAESFNRMAATREQASHAKDEFLGLVSHELKRRSRRCSATGDPAQPRRPSGSGVAAGRARRHQRQRAAAVGDHRQPAGAGTAGAGAGLESEPLALLRMTEATAGDQLWRNPGRQITVRGDANILVLAGETYVEQVLQNLIGNAVKYSAPDEPVEVSVESDGAAGVVRVFDRGAGIEIAEREAVFQPFYRSARTATTAEGMGIGLSVCKRLIESLDGHIWCNARPDGGSEFGFRCRLSKRKRW